MKFLQPQFLYAFAFLAIPVFIHLFNFRRTKTVYFSNISWLKKVDQQTKAQSKLKHLLLLLTRLLIFSFLILAFAEPYVPGAETNNAEEKAICIYIDNSFSMDGEAEQGHLLELAKQYAYNIVEAYGNARNYQILSNDFMSKHQRLVSAEEAMLWIDEVQLSPSYRNLDQVLQRQDNALMNKQLNRVSYIISDMQEGFITNMDYENAPVHLLPLFRESLANISIDSLYFSSPVIQTEKSASLSALLSNHSAENYEGVPINLSINNDMKAIGTVDISAGGSSWTTLKFKPGKRTTHLAKLQIDSDPISFDNTLYFNFRIQPHIRVAHIYDGAYNKGISALFGDETFRYESYSSSNIPLADLLLNDLIILDELSQISSGHLARIKGFVEQGGTVVMIPSEDINNNILQSFDLPTLKPGIQDSLELSALEKQHPLFYQVFEGKQENPKMPMVKRYFEGSVAGKNVINLSNGDVFLAEEARQKGRIYQFYAPLNNKNTDLIKNGLFVPLFYNMALLSQKRGRYYYELGKDKMVEMEKGMKGDQGIHIRNQQEDFIGESIQKQFILPQGMKNAGHFALTSGADTLQWISLNYNRKESDLAFRNREEIAQLLDKKGLSEWNIMNADFDQVVSVIRRADKGVSYWKHCLIFALLFLLMETILMRLFNK